MTSKPKDLKAKLTSRQAITAKERPSAAVKPAVIAKKRAAPTPPPTPASAMRSRHKPTVRKPAKGLTKETTAIVPNNQHKPHKLPKPVIAPVTVSKQSQLISKLGTGPGATIGQMMALTGWQAHTVRGTISGVLRKKLGLNVICASSSHGGERQYRIAPSMAA